MTEPESNEIRFIQQDHNGDNVPADEDPSMLITVWVIYAKLNVGVDYAIFRDIRQAQNFMHNAVNQIIAKDSGYEWPFNIRINQDEIPLSEYIELCKSQA